MLRTTEHTLSGSRKSTRETPDRKGMTSVSIIFNLVRDRLRDYQRDLLRDLVGDHQRNLLRDLLRDLLLDLCKLLAIYLLCSKAPRKKRKKEPPEKRKYCLPSPYPYPYQFPNPEKRKITIEDLLQFQGKNTRKEAAEILGASRSSVYRTWSKFGHGTWKNGGRKKVGRPPNQHGEGKTSTARKTLSYNVQPGMEGELVGQNQEANQFQRDSMEEFLLNGPNGIFSEWAFQLKNQRKVPISYPNSNGPEVPHPHIAPTQTPGENMGSLGGRRNSFGSLEDHLQLQGHISGSMYTVPPCSDPASSQHIPTIPPTMGSSEDQINSLTFLEDAFLEEVVSGSISSTIPSCSEPAPSHPMPTIPRTTGSSDHLRNLLPSVEESFPVGHVPGVINPTAPSCSYLAPSQPMPTVPHTTGSSDDLRNSLASVEEPFPAGHVSESINLTVPSGSDPAPSQSMPTILHTMPTNPRMMPLLAERQDTRSVNVKAMYGDTTIKFQFPLTSGVNELKEVMSKILERELGSFKVEYKDEDGEWILMALDENVKEYLQLVISLGNQVTKLKVRDKVSNTTNF